MSSPEYTASYRKKNREELRKKSKERYCKLKAAGLCVHCGKPNDTVFVLCSACKVLKNKSKKKHAQSPDGKQYNRNYNQQRRKTEKYKTWRRKYMQTRRKTDIQFKLACRLTDRLNKALKGIGSGQDAVRFLGCSIAELKVHLETQFVNGMTWENHGEWHIDHIAPLSSVDLTQNENLAVVCHFSNLQPLWAADNIRKGNKL